MSPRYAISYSKTSTNAYICVQACTRRKRCSTIASSPADNQQSPAAVAEEVTAHAISVGYRHVDSATVYRNEQPSAAGMLKGGIPREQLFFTSKVPPKSINYKDAKACVDESLKKTGLDYIDLYLLHAPYGGREGRLGAWKALVEAVAEGKVRSIGVSNYGVHHLDELEQWQKVRVVGCIGCLKTDECAGTARRPRRHLERQPG